MNEDEYLIKLVNQKNKLLKVLERVKTRMMEEHDYDPYIDSIYPEVLRNVPWLYSILCVV